MVRAVRLFGRGVVVGEKMFGGRCRFRIFLWRQGRMGGARVEGGCWRVVGVLGGGRARVGGVLGGVVAELVLGLQGD